jgi:alpha-galactosidase
MASVTTRCSTWQIASINGVHTCPPRRDNRLVTAARIAQKYEKMIIANPTWSIEAMKAIVQEEMFADVSDSKLKRAKSIVMQRALDSTKGQYKLLYNYQLELLRSNPSSTVVVKKDTDAKDDVFQRIYICLAALKKDFLAGCRKVVA